MSADNLRPEAGARIKISALGAARCPRLADRKGIIVGSGRYHCTVRVIFDGSKSPMSLHQDYIELVSTDADQYESESPTHVGMWRKCRGALRQHCLKVEEGIPSRDQNQRPAKIGRQLALTIDNAKRDGVEVSERADGS